MSELDFGDVVLFYEQAGTGRDLVRLAGGDQRGSCWHHFQVPAFADFRNTTYDARGVGETSCPAPPPWPIEAHAVDCARLIEGGVRPTGRSRRSLDGLARRPTGVARPVRARRRRGPMGTYAHASGYVREWEAAEVAFRRAGGELSLEFATAHYGAYMYPSEVLGDDALWEEVRPIVTRDYGVRDGEALAMGGLRRVRLTRPPATLPGAPARDRLLARHPDAARPRDGGGRYGAARPGSPALRARPLLVLRSSARRRQRVRPGDRRTLQVEERQ